VISDQSGELPRTKIKTFQEKTGGKIIQKIFSFGSIVR